MAARAPAGPVFRVPGVWVGGAQPEALAADLFRRREQGRLFLRRAAQGLRAHLGLVRFRQHLSAPLGHAARDAARIRHRHRVRPWHRTVARAGADGIGAVRPLHQGAERHATRDSRADLCRLVRTGYRVQGRARRHVGVLHRLLQRVPGRAGSELHRGGECAHPRRERPAAAAPRLRAKRDELGLCEPAQFGWTRVRRRGGRRVPGLVARRGLPHPAGGRHLRHQRRFCRHSCPYGICAAAGVGGRAGGAAPAGLAAAGRRNREDLMRWPLLLAALLASAVVAQPYPSRPVKVVVPFPPGATPDIVARPLSARLQDALGQPFVVENRSGAGGNIGTEGVAKAPADGYTLLVSINGPVATNKYLYRSLPYDPDKDLAPISLLATAPQMLVVVPELKLEGLRAFIDYARSHPGRISYASVGSGSASHLTMELLKSEARIEAVHVPYRGFPPAVTDMLAGNIQAMFAIIPGGLPHVKAGKMKGPSVPAHNTTPPSPHPRAARRGSVRAPARCAPSAAAPTANGSRFPDRAMRVARPAAGESPSSRRAASATPRGAGPRPARCSRPRQSPRCGNSA